MQNGEEQKLIEQTLGRLLADHCGSDVVDRAEAGEWPAKLWRALADTGLTLAGISEAHGGSGGRPADSMLAIGQAARFAAPVPLAEHFMAARLLELQGAALSAGVASVAGGDFTLSSGGRLKGGATEVAFARWCSDILVVAASDNGDVLVLAPRDAISVTESANLAGEPRDAIAIDVEIEQSRIFPGAAQSRRQLVLLGAATRSVMMAGALASTLDLAVRYSLERNQFGRPIARFQAIQQQLAILAGEVAASARAAQAVCAATESLDEVDIAIGKARIGEAVSACADIAHQVHGAMGYTMEHSLNHRTRRLWCWRDEYGAEKTWQGLVGRAMMAGGADGLWGKVTARN